jgi:hypothetical protein
VAKFVPMFTLRLALLSLLVWVLRPLDAAAAESQTLRYTVYSNSKLAGSEVDTYLPGGRVESAFEFNDRGRGPRCQPSTCWIQRDALEGRRNRQRLPESFGRRAL